MVRERSWGNERTDMWLINEDGFFSTVQDWKDDGWVYIRGRSETDLEAFVKEGFAR